VSSASPDRTVRSRADAADLALFQRTLAGLCRSEVPLPRALRLAGGEVGRGRVASAAADMAREVESGESFAAAYAKRPEVFPPLYAAVVDAGAAAGDLPAALEATAAHAAEEADAVRRVRSALLHPAITAGAALAIGAGAVLIASPTLWSLAETVGGSSPAPIALGALGLLAALLLGLLLFAWRGSPFAPGKGLRVPVIGPLRDARARASFASTLSLLLRRKMPLPKALEAAAACCAEPELAGRVEAMADRARKGEGLSEVLAAEDAFDPSLLWLAEGAKGEDEAAGALADVAGLLRRRFERGLERFQAVAAPAAEVVVGLVVLAFAYAYTVPLLRETNAILHLWGS
jgi:type II secretory pathway component PulF